MISKKKSFNICLNGFSGQTFHYRLRRVATRKNKTKRPMNLFKEELDKSIDEMKWAGKLWVYLEQDTDPSNNEK